MLLLIAICALTFFAVSAQSDEWTMGQATYHYFSGTTSCGIPGSDQYLLKHTPSFPYGFIAAMSEDTFNGGTACGGCFEIVCLGPYVASNIDCTCDPTKSIIIQAVDKSGVFSPPHFDISDNAWASFTNVCGHIKIKYRPVACEFTQNIEVITLENNAWWFGLRVENVAGYGQMCAMSIRSSGSSSWLDCGNIGSQWECDGPGETKLPITLKIQTCDGAELIGEDVVTKWGQNRFDFGSNFPFDSTPTTLANNPTSKPVSSPVDSPSSVSGTASFTHYTSFASCCPENPNYDITADTTECDDYSACDYPGSFWAIGQKSFNYVQQNNLIAFFDINDPNGETFMTNYGGKTITLTKDNTIITALIADSCGDHDCNGCCSTNSQPSGYLVDMEYWTVINHFGDLSSAQGQIDFVIHDTDNTSHSGNIIIRSHQSTSSIWWIAFYLENVDVSCGGVTNVQIKDNNNYNEWTPYTSMYGTNEYQFSNDGLALTLPLSVRINTTTDMLYAIDIITVFT
eukprot:200971_1